MSTPIVVPDLVKEMVQYIFIMCPALEESLPCWTVSRIMRSAMLLHTAPILMMSESAVHVKILCSERGQ